MSVEKIKRVEYTFLDDRAGDGIIEIELRDLFKPYLLGTSYCDKVVIWWDSHSHEYEESIKVYAIENFDHYEEDNPHVSIAERWYDCDLAEAMQYVKDEIYLNGRGKSK